MKAKVWTQLLVVSVCLLAAWGLQANCVVVPAEEASSLVGGGDTIPGWCIQTNSTCPDPRYSATTCTYSATDQWCYLCTMRVSSWTNCKFVNDPDFACGQTVTSSSPYCGSLYGSKPGGNGTDCTNGCAGLPSGTCGSQIPNTNGVPCIP